MGRFNDDEAVRKNLKVFVGGLPPGATDGQVGGHFARYGQVINVSLPPGDKPYAFVTFKFAADADCSVVDPQERFPGASRALQMGFARRKDDAKSASAEGDPCKVFVGGIGERDSEDEVGDFFSQWGLVALVYRDKSWGFVHFATKEGALRLLDEGSVVFQRRRIDVKASDSRRGPMDAVEKEDLVRRAVARHFHKKTMTLPYPYPSYPPAAYPPSYPAYPGYPAPAYYPPSHAHAEQKALPAPDYCRETYPSSADPYYRPGPSAHAPDPYGRGGHYRPY